MERGTRPPSGAAARACRVAGPVVAAFLLAAGCRSILGIDDPVPLGAGAGGGGGGGSPPAVSVSSSSRASSSSSGAGGAGAGGANEGGHGGSCATQTRELSVSQDAVLVDSPGVSCNGAIEWGSSEFMNIGVVGTNGTQPSRGVFRFDLPDEVATAFSDLRVRSLLLTLYRDFGPDAAAPGVLEVRPLRNDWNDGTGASYTGPDWCRRSAGSPPPQWAAAGAAALGTDIGDVSGTAPVDTAQPSVAIELDPDLHAPMVDVASGAWSLSTRVTIDLGGVFVAACREGDGVNAPPARLTVTFCVP
jgi:hypothetical protein